VFPTWWQVMSQVWQGVNVEVSMVWTWKVLWSVSPPFYERRNSRGALRINEKQTYVNWWEHPPQNSTSLTAAHPLHTSK
jgi:hypothetical protein